MVIDPRKPIVVREVWAHNLKSEFELISSVLEKFPFISMDTEFPGVVIKPPETMSMAHPSDRYRYLKANVDLLELIQLGLTLSDAAGNLPDLGSGNCHYIWQFNFSDFDISRGCWYKKESIELLMRCGINFDMNRVYGINSGKFAELAMGSGLFGNDSVSWVTFHGAYDFGYLVKVLTRRALPDNLGDFLEVVEALFRDHVYDVKHLMRFCDGMYGGLDQVAQKLNVNRVVGECHQAGSDSLLTWHAFQKIRDDYFVNKGGLEKYAGVLHGTLEVYRNSL